MMLALSFTLYGCGSQVSTATAAVNTAGRTLAVIDQAVGDQQKADRAAADLKFPDDNVAYGAALAKDNAIADALDFAWREQGLLHVALANWIDNNDRANWELAVVCASQALERLDGVLEQKWRAEISFGVAALMQFAGGTTQCAAAQVQP